MLDEIIAKIKALLGRSDEDEEEEEGTGVYSEQTGMLDTKTNMQKPPSDDDEEEDEGAEKISKIIRIVVVIAILYFAYDEFLAPKPPQPQPKNTKARKTPKKKKVAKKKPTAVPTLAATPEATPEPMVEATPEATPEPMVEATPEATPEPMAEKTPEATTDMAGEDPLADMISDAVVKPTPPPVETQDMDPSKALDDLDKQMNDEKDADTAGSTKGLSALGEALSKMKESPKKKMAITKAPDYLITGRGLVYNCRGKHWACVDKKSYFKCAANQKESKKFGKKPDCGTVAVYQTEDDCQVIQLYNINTSQKTDFCSQ